VHAPQSAIPQPNLVPVNPNVSRSTQSSGVSGVTSTDCTLPFTVIEIASMNIPLCQRDKSTFRAPELQSSFTRRHGSADTERNWFADGN
jgi:hypothetical protein